MRRTTILLIPIAALLVLAAPASAGPQSGWSAPRTVPTVEAGATNPTVSIDASGRAVVAWERHSDSFNAIRVAAEIAPGQFGETRTLSGGSESDLRLSGVVSDDDDGETLVVWCSQIDGNLRVRAAQSAPGGSFGPAQTLSSSPVRNCPRVAINAKGDAAVVWSGYGQPRIAFKPASGTFGPEQQVAGPGSDFPTTVAVDAGAAALILWGSSAGPDGATRFAFARRSPAASITAGSYVSPVYQQAALNQVDYDIAADGSVSAIWDYFPGQNPAPIYSAVAGNVDPGLGAAKVLNEVFATGVRAQPVALDARAGTTGLLSHSDTLTDVNGCRRLGMDFNPGTGSGVGGGLALPPDQATGWTGDRSIGGDPGTIAVAVWRRGSTAEPHDGETCGKLVPAEATAALFTPGSGLGAPVSLSDPRYPASIPRASQGARLAAAWTCFDGRRDRIQIASYDLKGAEPLWCGPEDLNPPKVRVRATRYPVRWRSSSKPSPRASCHEQCTVTVGLLLFSRGHRAAKLGVSEQVLKPNKVKRLDFPKLGRGGRRLVTRTVKRRSNVRLIYRLRFDDLASNSVLKTARVRLLP